MNIIFSLLLIPVTTFGWQKESEKIIIKDPLTLVLTFGAENLPEEYLIASEGINKNSFAVDNNNKIYLFEEFKIKVYDSNGKALAIIGRKGEGPGEFSIRNGSIAVGPTGFITASRSNIAYVYNVFFPNYKFLKVSRKEPPKIENESFIKEYTEVVSINENEDITLTCRRRKSQDIYYLYTYDLEYWKNGVKIIIASYSFPADVIKGNSWMSLSFVGGVYWSFISPNTILYIHSRMDEKSDESGNYYVLHTYTLNTGKRNEIKIQYTPVPLSKEDLKTGGTYFFSPFKEEDYKDDLFKMRIEYLKKNNIKNYEAIQSITFDGQLLFIETSLAQENKKDRFFNDKLYDVINPETGKYISSLILPSRIGYFTIKNGYLYSSGISSDGYTVIDKYKIDPKVYGK